MTSKRILFTTLNWGLGHSTRSIPLIRYFKNLGHEIFLASDGPAGMVLRQEFPELPYFELPSYQIYYSDKSFYRHWIRHFPRIIKAIQEEKKRIGALMNQHRFEVIISDNRYGTYDLRSKNILLTHQLYIQLPMPFAELVSGWICHRVNRFDQCWIPDFEGDGNLSGKLSSRSLSIEKYYIGPLSRFTKKTTKPVFDLGIIISGPEPSRSIFQSQVEKRVYQEGLHKTMKIFWVLGKPELQNSDGRDTWKFNHLRSNQMNHFLNQTEILLSRSGYSSIMDYHILDKKAILIPTPNQPEQEYLAGRSVDNPRFHVCDSEMKKLKESIYNLKEVKMEPKPSFKNHIPAL